jgi:hypothetical protein
MAQLQRVGKKPGLMIRMKTITRPGLILLMAVIFSCHEDENESIQAINGLSLYWDHEVFGEEGRRLRFEVTTTNEFDNDYELEFSTSVIDESITVVLIKSIDKGKCQYFPMPVTGDDDPYKCNASGTFYLADTEIDNGVYSLKIIMPAFEVTSELTVTDEKVTLEIPANKFLNSTIDNVYPIPQNLLFGNIGYEGSDNTNDAVNFLDYLTDLGLIQTTLPNYPYRYLTVDENGHPPVSHWEPDNHSIGFLYKLNTTDVKTIFEASTQYFNQHNVNIYLYTSNGDEGLMNKSEGITLVYSE